MSGVMSTSTDELLRQLGVYLQPDFLSPDECSRIIADMQEAKTEPAGVYDKELGKKIDPEKRKVGEVAGSLSEGLLLGFRRFERCAIRWPSTFRSR